jgi:hypothetical protein
MEEEGLEEANGIFNLAGIDTEDDFVKVPPWASGIKPGDIGEETGAIVCNGLVDPVALSAVLFAGSGASVFEADLERSEILSKPIELPFFIVPPNR